MWKIWKADKIDFLVVVGTFFGVIFASVEIGLLIGVALSMFKILVLVTRPHLAILGEIPGAAVYRNIRQYKYAKTQEGILALRIDAPIFFTNANFIRERVLTMAEKYESQHGIELTVSTTPIYASPSSPALWLLLQAILVATMPLSWALGHWVSVSMQGRFGGRFCFQCHDVRGATRALSLFSHSLSCAAGVASASPRPCPPPFCFSCSTWSSIAPLSLMWTRQASTHWRSSTGCSRPWTSWYVPLLYRSAQSLLLLQLLLLLL